MGAVFVAPLVDPEALRLQGFYGFCRRRIYQQMGNFASCWYFYQRFRLPQRGKKAAAAWIWKMGPGNPWNFRNKLDFERIVSIMSCGRDKLSKSSVKERKEVCVKEERRYEQESYKNDRKRSKANWGAGADINSEPFRVKLLKRYEVLVLKNMKLK